MEMADNPKLTDMETISCGGEENKIAQKISISDHINGFQYKKSDNNFVIDMETFSHGIVNKDINQNSSITLQRNHSRKGSQRGGGAVEKMTNSNDNIVVASSSPRGSGMPEKQTTTVAVGTTAEHSSNNNPHVHHHQITITTGGTNPENRFGLRRGSFKRSSSSWGFDPKRVLFFFATLSSMGTILLIYFTLAIGKYGGDESTLD